MEKKPLTDDDRRRILARLQLIFRDWSLGGKYDDVPLMDLITDVMLVYEIHLGYRMANFEGDAPDGVYSEFSSPVQYWRELREIRDEMRSAGYTLLEGTATDMMDRLVRKVETMFDSSDWYEYDVKKEKGVLDEAGRVDQ